MKSAAPLVAALGLLAAGCATPESRIKKSPEVFNALPPEMQEQVRQGRIDIGYPKEAVHIALGPPNRQYTRKTADRSTEVWSYTRDEIRRDRQRADVRISGYDSKGRRATYNDWVWVDVESRQEYERLRVEFSDNAVSAIERMER